MVSEDHDSDDELLLAAAGGRCADARGARVDAAIAPAKARARKVVLTLRSPARADVDWRAMPLTARLRRAWLSGLCAIILQRGVEIAPDAINGPIRLRLQ